MRRLIAVLSALVAVLGGLAPPLSPAAAADAIVVSAAASLKNALEEIGARHAASDGGPRPAFNFGASGDLAAQIRGGAPVDVIASAAAREMDRLESDGLLLPGTRVDFAANELVLVVPSTAGAALSSFAGLAQPGITRIAIVNPKTAPAGRYAEEVLAHAGIIDAVRPKLVLAETVRQVLDYAARGEVDAGVVYSTDATLRPREVMVAAVAPAGSHQPVIYPIAVLKGSTRPDAAKAFLAAVRSDVGREIFARYGFRPVPAAR